MLCTHRVFCTHYQKMGTSSKVILRKGRKTIPSALERVLKVKKTDKDVTIEPKKLDKKTEYYIEQKVKSEDISDKSEFRRNEVGVQMISRNIFEQLFEKNDIIHDIKIVKRCKERLKFHNISSENGDKCEDILLKLPKLQGNDILQHFYNIGEQHSLAYKNLIEKIIKTDVPTKPKEWVLKSGWHKYNSDGTFTQVPFPSEHVLVFDVEVCMSAGSDPTLACAVSPTNWYGWVSDALFEGNSQATNTMEGRLDNLIPMESSPDDKPYKLNKFMLAPKLIIGHNVSYDRARIREQYWIEKTATRFLDTMSMHVCVSGVTSYQRAILKSKGKEIDPDDVSWMNISSLNSLADVYKLYCQEEISKEPRNVFVEGSLLDVKEDFQNLMMYCAGDVVATLSVLKNIYPMFKERFPHPVTLAGMLELGTSYLPINSSWRQYVDFANVTFEDVELECKVLLAKRAEEACRLMHDKQYLTDLWMWDQDWSTQRLESKKGTLIKKVKKKKKDLDNTQNSELECVADESIENVDDTKPSEFGYFDHTGSFKLLNKNDLISEENNGKTDLDNLDVDNCYNHLSKKFEHLYNMPLPIRRPFMPGYPAWYRKLCVRPTKDSENEDWIYMPFNISTSMQITPKLMCLSWEGYPLHYIRGHGWGFLVPYSSEKPSEEELQLYCNNKDEINHNVPFESLLEKCSIIEPRALAANALQSEAALHTLWKDVEAQISKKDYYSKPKKSETDEKYTGTGIWSGVTLGGVCFFMRLPHKDGVTKKVGNPLSKDFVNKFSENVLIGESKDAEKVLTAARMLSYWRNNRDRVMQQKVIWFENKDLPKSIRDKNREYGVILPQIVVCGTLTRRAMEPTWIVASNAHKERIGSELRAIVQSFPGYSFVGADVDSQELWIASILGDSKYKIHGATPFGWMTLSGSKAAGTDMHSHTAKAANITRDHAKVINYARIYGAGQNFAERLLKQFNPAISDGEAKQKARKMFTTTKGQKFYRLKEKYIKRVYGEDYVETPEQPLLMNLFYASQIAKQNGMKLDMMFEKSKWTGGTESEMFNSLEEIAGSDEPRTPFLNCQLTRALMSDEELRKRHLPTAINWVVQSGAVDFLHLMLVNMLWLTGGKARFCLSFHDEVRYLIPDEYKYETALALHITNLYTRAFCAKRLGFNDLPLSVAFFSSVDVDTSLRKEAHLNCVTPSNPHGLEGGYGIPKGECLDIYQTLEKCPDGLGKLYQDVPEKKVKKTPSKEQKLTNNNECAKNL